LIGSASNYGCAGGAASAGSTSGFAGFYGATARRPAPAKVRELATDGLRYLGIAVDAERNRAIDADGEISAAAATAATLVLAAREDLEIARQVRAAPRRRSPAMSRG
jgi:acetate kinase